MRILSGIQPSGELHLGNFFGAGDQVVMFGNRLGDTGHIGFLKGVAADQMGRHLADFLATDDATEGQPWLDEMARFA